MRAVGEDGVEALLKIVLTLGAKRFELFRRAEFGDRLFADRVLEPVDEARDGHAVLDVARRSFSCSAGVFIAFIS